jgi:hypothetical protein
MLSFSPSPLSRSIPGSVVIVVGAIGAVSVVFGAICIVVGSAVVGSVVVAAVVMSEEGVGDSSAIDEAFADTLPPPNSSNSNNRNENKVTNFIVIFVGVVNDIILLSLPFCHYCSKAASSVNQNQKKGSCKA